MYCGFQSPCFHLCCIRNHKWMINTYLSPLTYYVLLMWRVLNNLHVHQSTANRQAASSTVRSTRLASAISTDFILSQERLAFDPILSPSFVPSVWCSLGFLNGRLSVDSKTGILVVVRGLLLMMVNNEGQQFICLAILLYVLIVMILVDFPSYESPIILDPSSIVMFPQPKDSIRVSDTLSANSVVACGAAIRPSTPCRLSQRVPLPQLSYKRCRATHNKST